MKRLLFFSTLLCLSIIMGCKDDIDPDMKIGQDGDIISLLNGAITINHSPNVVIEELNEFPVETGTTPAVNIKTDSGIRLLSEDDPKANNYRFKLVAEMGALELTDAEGIERTVQAAEVKVSDDGYVFVAYNHRLEPNIGGLVVYKYTVTNGSLANANVHLTAVSSIKLRQAQINAIEFDGNKLYLAGASQEPDLGYNGEDPAFFIVMELDAERKFKSIEPEMIKYLTSYQANSIRKFRDRLYITTGDGTEGSKGGLYILDANTYEQVDFIEVQHARSVDVDESGVYLMQANHARVSKLGFDGEGATEIYNVANEAMQKHAKSQVLAWNNYLFIAQNETGLKMLNKDGSLNDQLGPPNNNDHPEWDVTNGVSINSDAKLSSLGTSIETNLLLVANGRQGLYWYDIMTDDNGKDVIVQSRRNRILAEIGPYSTNFVASKGNVVFVANGLGGLKVLYIGFRVEEIGCVAPCEYHIYTDGVASAIIDGNLVGITRFRLVDDCENIEHAYCADMNTPCYEGARYKCAVADHFKNDEPTKIMAAFTYIMNRHKSMETTNVHGYRQMIQSVIWRIIHGYPVDHIYNTEGPFIMSTINHVYNNIGAITAAYREPIVITGNATEANGLFGPFKIADNIIINDVVFNLSGNNIEFVNPSGTKITQAKADEQFYVRVPVGTTGEIKFNASAAQQMWYVDNYNFYIDMRDDSHPFNYQPLIQEVVSSDALPFFSAEKSFIKN